MRGFSIIELVISICIIGILSVFFFNTMNVLLKMHDDNITENEKKYTSLMIGKQLRDEIFHSVSVSSQNSGNLIIKTYDSSDTDSTSTFATNISYNFIGGKLYKYNENFADTVCFEQSFDTVAFEVFSCLDSSVRITMIDNNNKADIYYISQRN